MKIGVGLYFCPYCKLEVKHKRVSVSADVNPNTKLPGRHTFTAPLRCPQCNKLISQRTKEGLR